jgi:hypothetical protein
MKVFPLSARVIPFAGITWGVVSTPGTGPGGGMIMAGQLHMGGGGLIDPIWDLAGGAMLVGQLHTLAVPDEPPDEPTSATGVLPGTTTGMGCAIGAAACCDPQAVTVRRISSKIIEILIRTLLHLVLIKTLPAPVRFRFFG